MHMQTTQIGKLREKYPNVIIKKCISKITIRFHEIYFITCHTTMSCQIVASQYILIDSLSNR